MKKKAAFVDHSFHKKTQCTVCLKQLLSERFELVEYYDESWNGGNEVDINLLTEYEYIFYFQVIHNAKKFKSLENNKAKIIWFPMWDSVAGMKNSEWLRYQTIPIKIVCFSKTLYHNLHKLGFDCEYFQYFIDPQRIEPVNDYDSKRVFFWNRIEIINWEVIKRLIGDTYIDSVSFMAVPDPYQNPKIPSEVDIKNYNIQLYNQFLNSKDYLYLVSKANIYFAPRKFEGIGMSFLEALCSGQFVIAPNFPTMNEYITHGENGYLYDIDSIHEIDFKNFEAVGKKARIKMIEGYKNWIQEQKEFVKSIVEFEPTTRINILITIKIIFFKILELLSLITHVLQILIRN
jgi:glycosyltransferase involved in cell wall biosynthesis